MLERRQAWFLCFNTGSWLYFGKIPGVILVSGMISGFSQKTVLIRKVGKRMIEYENRKFFLFRTMAVTLFVTIVFYEFVIRIGVEISPLLTRLGNLLLLTIGLSLVEV